MNNQFERDFQRIMAEPVLEFKHADIFGGYDDNNERMARYLAKRVLGRGPYILEYEARGDTFFTAATTPAGAINRTNEKEPQGWMFNNIKTEREFFQNDRQKPLPKSI